MINLLTLQEYRDDFYKDESGYWKRMPVVAGCFFGVSMAIWFFFILGNTPNLLHPRTPLEILLIGLFSGLFFGFAFRWHFRRSLWQNMKRLYFSDPALSATLDSSFTHRLPCTWVKGSLGIGGVLYAGSSGLLFLPQGKTPLTSLRMEPVQDISVRLSPSPYPPNILQGVLVPIRKPLMEIRWGMQSAYFLVPAPAKTTALFRGLIEPEN